MEERYVCCCGSMRRTLVLGCLQFVAIFEIFGITALLLLINMGDYFLEVLKLEKDERNILGISTTYLLMLMGIVVILAILTVLSIIMAVILIRAWNNKNTKQLNIWRMYAKIQLVIVLALFIARYFVIPVEPTPMPIVVFCIQVAIQVFCIWLLGVYTRDIEASSGTVVA